MGCHGPRKSKGRITLHNLEGDLSLGQEHDRWERILDVLERQEMPPEDEENQPSAQERAAVVRWIQSALRDAIETADPLATATTMRRLTNFEYQNTLRDLLGFELELAKDLPPDPDKPYHFNNTPELMMIGPDQLERYKEAARKAMASAIVRPEEPEVYRSHTQWDHDKPGKGGLSQAEIGVYQGPGVGRKTVSLKSWPQTGAFRIRVVASGTLPPGFTEAPLRLVMGTDLRHDSGTGIYHEVGTAHLTNPPDAPQEFEFLGRIENVPIQPARPHRNRILPPSIIITAQNIFDNGQLNDHRKSAFDASWSAEAPRVVLHSIEFEAPITDTWPPESHKRILFASPLRDTDVHEYAYQVIQRFLTRAFRRPVYPEEVQRFYHIYEIFDSEFNTLEETLRETLAMALISPQFLYHSVTGEAATQPYELASRLSYFLWGSMPDTELTDLAAAGRLNDPAIIETQARRMLADPRANGFFENFTTQWLSIAKMKTVNINRDLFPRFLYTVHVGERRGQEVLFRPTIRDYMHEETVGFIRELIKTNANLMNIVDSNFAYLNEPLAAHYGIEGVQGLRFRTVSIQPEHRLGGLLTQGSVLVGNSTGSAPHPIYRAVWLREAILGERVQPPPAEVPALSDSAGESADEAVSIKDLLAIHRKKETCFDCHARLDPWGIPFERYSAAGNYQPHVPKDTVRIRGFSQEEDRTFTAYQAYLNSVYTERVDVSSRLPNGPEVDGMMELKEFLLKERKDDIAENLIRRLMSYSLGRELNYRDRFEVERLVKMAKQNGYKLQDMVVSVCQSPTFTGLNTQP